MRSTRSPVSHPLRLTDRGVAFWQRHHWYVQAAGCHRASVALNRTGKPERVLSPRGQAGEVLVYVQPRRSWAATSARSPGSWSALSSRQLCRFRREAGEREAQPFRAGRSRPTAGPPRRGTSWWTPPERLVTSRRPVRRRRWASVRGSRHGRRVRTGRQGSAQARPLAVVRAARLGNA